MGDALAPARGLATACVVALLVALAGRRCGGVAGRIAGAVAVVLGVVAGLTVVPALPRWPPTAALDRLLLLALPAVAAVELAAVTVTAPWVITIGRGLAALALAPVLLHGSVHVGPGAGRGWWEAVAGAVLLAGAVALVSGGRRPRDSLGSAGPDGAAVAGTVEIVASALALATAGLAIPMAGYVKGGVVALVLTAALVGSLAGGAREGLGGMALAGLFGIVGVGRFFGGLSAPAAALVCLAPLAAAVAGRAGDRLERCPASRILRSVAYRIAVATVPLAVVLLHAWLEFARSFRPLMQ